MNSFGKGGGDLTKVEVKLSFDNLTWAYWTDRGAISGQFIFTSLDTMGLSTEQYLILTSGQVRTQTIFL